MVVPCKQKCFSASEVTTLYKYAYYYYYYYYYAYYYYYIIIMFLAQKQLQWQKVSNVKCECVLNVFMRQHTVAISQGLKYAKCAWCRELTALPYTPS